MCTTIKPKGGRLQLADDDSTFKVFLLLKDVVISQSIIICTVDLDYARHCAMLIIFICNLKLLVESLTIIIPYLPDRETEAYGCQVSYPTLHR